MLLAPRVDTMDDPLVSLGILASYSNIKLDLGKYVAWNDKHFESCSDRDHRRVVEWVSAAALSGVGRQS